MANADQFYADPSALLKLYLHQPQSRAMATWRARLTGPLAVTPHGRVELINGLALAVHRGWLPEAGYRAALAALDDDFEQGRYAPADLLWRAVLKRAADFSRLHTPGLGTRSLDVLHVASALELGLKRFVTFDDRQGRLAAAAGLKVIVPAA
ncbi:MAG: PIN domain nuclease [Opitutia bacterium Tous-C1TDCM]|nr:MAG: PIN domain nuclease [Opitutae bacterium Tous-C1TDCM]